MSYDGVVSFSARVKTCPFCGGREFLSEIDVSSIAGIPIGFTVEQTCAGCKMVFSKMYANESIFDRDEGVEKAIEKFIDLWNQRAHKDFDEIFLKEANSTLGSMDKDASGLMKIDTI